MALLLHVLQMLACTNLRASAQLTTDGTSIVRRDIGLHSVPQSAGEPVFTEVRGKLIRTAATDSLSKTRSWEWTPLGIDLLIATGLYREMGSPVVRSSVTSNFLSEFSDAGATVKDLEEANLISERSGFAVEERRVAGRARRRQAHVVISPSGEASEFEVSAKPMRLGDPSPTHGIASFPDLRAPRRQWPLSRPRLMQKKLGRRSQLHRHRGQLVENTSLSEQLAERGWRRRRRRGTSRWSKIKSSAAGAVASKISAAKSNVKNVVRKASSSIKAAASVAVKGIMACGMSAVAAAVVNPAAAAKAVSCIKEQASTLKTDLVKAKHEIVAVGKAEASKFQKDMAKDTGVMISKAVTMSNDLKKELNLGNIKGPEAIDGIIKKLIPVIVGENMKVSKQVDGIEAKVENKAKEDLR